MESTNTMQNILKAVPQNIPVRSVNRTKNVKGAFGSPKRKVDPRPTHTELNSMIGCAAMRLNGFAVGILAEYSNGKTTWMDAYTKLKEGGFNSFGYKRGFVGITA